MGSKLFETAVCDSLARGDKAKLRRTGRLFGGRTLRPVEKFAQRDCMRFCIDNAKPPIVLERRDAVSIYKEASSDD